MLLRILGLFLEFLSDVEFRVFSKAFTDEQFWRKKHLKFLGVKFEKKFRFGHSIYIRNGRNISLGNNCCIGSFARIWDYSPISIGNDFISAGGLTLNSATHDPINLAPKGSPIRIGSNVWCGMNVTILAGVTIGNNVVLGAGSVVVKDIPDNCIALGVPAKPIKELDRNGVVLWNPFLDM